MMTGEAKSNGTTFVSPSSRVANSSPRAHGKPVITREMTMNVPPVVVGTREYTRGSIARSLGVSTSHISKVFSGRRRPGTVLTLRLAAFFGITVEELLTRVIPGYQPTSATRRLQESYHAASRTVASRPARPKSNTSLI